ncbi:MAG: hypothetical protein U1F59_11735 [Candidatus Competibacteraceae bacterium]
MIRLTYGFCSPLAGGFPAARPDSISTRRTTNRLGHPVCTRLGAAVDFIIDDENMLEVAQWIVTNTLFDRLYYYGVDLPVPSASGRTDRQSRVDGDGEIRSAGTTSDLARKIPGVGAGLKSEPHARLGISNMSARLFAQFW